MSAGSEKLVMSSRESYQQAVIILLGTRRQKPDMEVTEFLSRHKALIDLLNERWLGLKDKAALPSPDQILSWL